MSELEIRRSFVSCVAAGIAVLANGFVHAQPERSAVYGSISLSSEYVLNGLSQTHDEPSLRLSLDFGHPSGFFAGGGFANVDYRAEEQFRAPRDVQANVYAGYVWRRSQWMTNLTLSRYRYPGIERSYDYTQAAVNVSFRDRYFFTASRTSDYLSIYGAARVYRAGIALPSIRNLEFGVNAGRFTANGFFDTAYSFWDIGLSRPIGRFAFDLRYHDNTYGYSSLLGNEARDLWVLSLTYTFLPRASASR